MDASDQPARWAILDFETTGLSPIGDRLVEVGCVQLDADFNVVGELNELINPERPIPEAVTAIHTITWDMVRDSPNECEMMPQIMGALEGCTLVAHNAKFDADFLAMALQRCQWEVPDLRVVDTVALAKQAMPAMRSYRLGTLTKALKIELTDAHRAIHDARATAELFKTCMARLKLQTVEDVFAQVGGFTLRTMLESPDDPAQRALAAKLREIMEVQESIDIDYLSQSTGRTWRKVIPQALTQRRAEFLLEAYCYYRDDTRSFKLSQIRGVRYPSELTLDTPMVSRVDPNASNERIDSM